MFSQYYLFVSFLLKRNYKEVSIKITAIDVSGNLFDTSLIFIDEPKVYSFDLDDLFDSSNQINEYLIEFFSKNNTRHSQQSQEARNAWADITCNKGIEYNRDYNCEISSKNGAIFVADLDSSNGIQHNGRRVKECQLRPGDLLTIGAIAFSVVGEESDSEASPTPSPSELSSSDHARERMRAEARASRRSSGLGDLGQLSSGIQLLVGALSLLLLWGIIQLLRFLI